MTQQIDQSKKKNLAIFWHSIIS